MKCPKCQVEPFDEVGGCCWSCGYYLRDEAAATCEEIGSTPARGSAALRWTAEKPAAAGWWWVMAEGHAAQIREFEIELNPMCAEDHPIQPVGGPLSTEGWKWFAGPLREPENAPDEATPPNARISD